MLNSNTLKRFERTSEMQRPKSKTLQILPNLTEEDEYIPKRSTGASRVHPVDLTILSETSFSTPPRRAPRPPAHDNRVSLAGLSLDFPSPPKGRTPSPVTLTRSSATKSAPLRFKRPSHSPTSSISSTSAISVASTSTGIRAESTPATSEDDLPVKPKMLSLGFAQSLPDLHRDVIQQFNLLDVLSDSDSEESEAEDDEDSEWITQEMKDFIEINSYSPGVAGFASEEHLAPARPESFLPPPRASKRFSRIYSSFGPSAQLDPTFPFTHKKQLSCPPVPTRPPPPPPVKPSPAFLAPPSPYPASASTASTPTPLTPLSSNSIRPPPRSSIPCDVDELMQMDFNDFDLLENELRQGLPESPFSAAYSDHHSSPTSSVGFDVSEVPSRVPSTPGHAIPDSPVAQMYRKESVLRRQTSTASAHDHPLRSRWSTSTLSSMNTQSPTSSSWMSKFTLRNKKSKVPPVPSLPSPVKPVKKEKQRKFTGPNLLILLDELERPDSGSSRKSSDSTDSAASLAGLRRPPIPVEIFMRF